MNVHANDSLLDSFVREASAHADVLGLVLQGSRGAGAADTESDYDLVVVLTDAAHAQREAYAASLPLHRFAAHVPPVDLWYSCPDELAQIAAQPSWRNAGFATAQILFDRNGAVAQALDAINHIPAVQAQHEAAAWFDGYLNAYYRSLKAWRRGDELGGRLQTAESIMHLVRTLFALVQRWPPYHDRLHVQLHMLDDHGWSAGYLHATLLELARTGDPALQQALERQVEQHMRSRGYGHVVDGWHGEIERVSAFHFEPAVVSATPDE